ncbi:MAG: AraC family transcriptional regulator [Pseudomonadota bacterium]|nr:AraC family transcriptional regulator [Pseudomonadales bacterium]MDY6918685.1 AraC family transcriptional regulator [Pseudomonadota bacterium]
MSNINPSDCNPELDRLSANALYAALLVEMLVQRGVILAELLAGTGISLEALKSLEQRLSARQYQALIENALRLDPDPALGFKFGFQLKLSTHGFLGFAAMSAATLGEALELAVKYCRTRFDFFNLHILEQRGKVILQVDPLVEFGPASAFLLESVMASFGTMSINLLGEIPKGVRIRRTCGKPAYFEAMEDWFPQRAPVEFEQSANQLIFEQNLMRRPLNLSDPLARQLAEAQCQKELQTIQVEDDLLYRVHRLLKEAEPDYPKLDQVAAQLHLSSRTLKRRLQEQGTSFQALLDRVRMHQARQLLKTSRQSVDAIASALGYSDASNFSRAFRRCEGLTPARYRRQQQANAQPDSH